MSKTVVKTATKAASKAANKKFQNNPRRVRYRSSAETLKHFGSFVAHRRLAMGLQAQELAQRMGTSPTVISRIESGEREPRLDLLRRINLALGIEDALIEYLRNGKFPLPDGFIPDN